MSIGANLSSRGGKKSGEGAAKKQPPKPPPFRGRNAKKQNAVVSGITSFTTHVSQFFSVKSLPSLKSFWGWLLLEWPSVIALLVYVSSFPDQFGNSEGEGESESATVLHRLSIFALSIVCVFLLEKSVSDELESEKKDEEKESGEQKQEESKNKKEIVKRTRNGYLLALLVVNFVLMQVARMVWETPSSSIGQKSSGKTFVPHKSDRSKSPKSDSSTLPPQDDSLEGFLLNDELERMLEDSDILRRALEVKVVGHADVEIDEDEDADLLPPSLEGSASDDDDEDSEESEKPKKERPKHHSEVPEFPKPYERPWGVVSGKIEWEIDPETGEDVFIEKRTGKKLDRSCRDSRWQEIKGSGAAADSNTADTNTESNDSKSATDSNLPTNFRGQKVSIIIPARWEEKYIVPTLKYIFEETPMELLEEVIVIDDNSEVPIEPVIASALGERSLQLTGKIKGGEGSKGNDDVEDEGDNVMHKSIEIEGGEHGDDLEEESAEKGIGDTDRERKSKSQKQSPTSYTGADFDPEQHLYEQIYFFHDFLKELTPPQKRAIKVVRLADKRQGLIRAKVYAVSHTSKKTTHLFFLDAHCRVQSGYMEALMGRSLENYKRIVTPMVPDVDSKNWDIVGVAGAKMMFKWNFSFDWFDDPGDYVPILSGGLLLMTKRWWNEITGYDLGMQEWGGENIEQSMRVWMCGGEVVVERNAVIGHIFHREVGLQKDRVTNNNVARNLARAGYSWLDDYYKVFQKEIPMTREFDLSGVKIEDLPLQSSGDSRNHRGGGGNSNSTEEHSADGTSHSDSHHQSSFSKKTLSHPILERLLYRFSLGCHPFKWFLGRFEDIMEEKGMLVESQHHIRHGLSGLCLEAYGWNEDPEIFPKPGSDGRDKKMMEMQGHPATTKHPGERTDGPIVQLAPCDPYSAKQKWGRINGKRRLVNASYGKCLDRGNDAKRTNPILFDCDRKMANQNQIWYFTEPLDSPAPGQRNLLDPHLLSARIVTTGKFDQHDKVIPEVDEEELAGITGVCIGYVPPQDPTSYPTDPNANTTDPSPIKHMVATPLRQMQGKLAPGQVYDPANPPVGGFAALLTNVTPTFMSCDENHLENPYLQWDLLW